MKTRLKKIAIGTANFGMKYGINKKKLSDKKIKDILKTAKKYGINTIDTAQSYGDAEEKLGLHKNKFKYITKVSNLKNISKQKIIDVLNFSLNNLKINKIDCVMFHNFKEFEKNKFKLPKFFLSKRGILFNKIGVSIYRPEELYKCIKFKELDCIQIPFNLLDYRWNNVDFYKIKKNNKSLEIHVRSIFLKGMLPYKIKYLPSWFKYKKKLSKRLSLIKQKNKIDLENILFSFVFQQKWIDKIVIGFSSAKQLKKIKSFTKYSKSIKVNKNYFNFIPKKLLMPKYW